MYTGKLIERLLLIFVTIIGTVLFFDGVMEIMEVIMADAIM